MRADEVEPAPGAFYQAKEQKPENLAAATARLFLGVRVECAQCHDHRYDPIPQTDYYRLRAVLEPAYEVGGDAFDYGIDNDVAHVAVFDAMGHDVTAGLAANLAVASYRNSRREGAPLLETGQAIEATLVEHLGTNRYVTALIADLDLRTGSLKWVSHGHHPPVRIRGGRMVDLPVCQPGSPLGVDLGLGATVCEERLHPGDRLVLFTDGITETHNPGGDEFGLDRFVNFIIRHNAEGLPIPETLRRLIHNILDYHGGTLQDDATVLFMEWHGS